MCKLSLHTIELSNPSLGISSNTRLREHDSSCSNSCSKLALRNGASDNQSNMIVPCKSNMLIARAVSIAAANMIICTISTRHAMGTSNTAMSRCEHRSICSTATHRYNKINQPRYEHEAMHINAVEK